MYQLGLQVNKKKTEGGECIFPMLNISKGHPPPFMFSSTQIQFYRE